MATLRPIVSEICRNQSTPEGLVCSSLLTEQDSNQRACSSRILTEVQGATNTPFFPWGFLVGIRFLRIEGKSHYEDPHTSAI